MLRHSGKCLAAISTTSLLRCTQSWSGIGGEDVLLPWHPRHWANYNSRYTDDLQQIDLFLSSSDKAIAKRSLAIFGRDVLQDIETIEDVVKRQGQRMSRARRRRQCETRVAPQLALTSVGPDDSQSKVSTTPHEAPRKTAATTKRPSRPAEVKPEANSKHRVARKKSPVRDNKSSPGKSLATTGKVPRKTNRNTKSQQDGLWNVVFTL